jgi:hypothetical protein
MRADPVNGREGVRVPTRQQKHAGDGIDERRTASFSQRSGCLDLHAGVRELALQDAQRGRCAATAAW